MAHKKVEPRVGDIFQIPIAENKFSYGQVIFDEIGPNPLYVAIFEKVTEKEGYNIDEILTADIVFLTHTVDGKIWNGDWVIVGNKEPNLSRIPKTCYKFGEDDDCFIEDYEGATRRKASKSESEIVDYRFSVAPVRIEKAFRAYLGIDAWNSNYDKLTFKHVQETSRVTI